MSTPDEVAASVDTALLTWGNFLRNNLLPVTLGNIVGGAGLVGVPYWLALRRNAFYRTQCTMGGYEHEDRGA